MNRVFTRGLALLLSVLLCTAAFGTLAAAEDEAGDASLPIPYVYEDEHRLLSFDKSNGVLTIRGDGSYIQSPSDFWSYINAIAPYTKTVYLSADAILRNRDAHGSDYYLFEKALSALTNVEAFDVEAGSANYAVRGGVLYDSTVTILMHYPAGKPGESYQMESNCMEIHPFAFCNTQHLRVLHFNYTHILLPMPSLLANMVSDGSRRHFMTIDEYGLGNIDLATGAPKESSIRTLVWYGKESELREIAARHQGNNIVADASISVQSTNFFKDVTLFYNRMLFVLGFSKENSRALGNDWKEQLQEAFESIFGSLGIW